MNRTIFSFIAIGIFIITLVSCQKDRYIQGSGQILSEYRDNLKGFTGVSSEGDYEVFIEQNDSNYFEVKVDADKNFMPYVSTVIEGYTLAIHTTNNKIFEGSDPVRIYIKVPRIIYLNLSGSGLLACDDVYNTKMDIVLSGSGIISMYNLDTETLTAKLSGSGSIELQGVATTAKLSIPGSGRIKGYSVRTPSTTTGKLEMNDCEVSISGSGQAFVYVWDYLDIYIPGSGSVYYRGHPKDLFVDIPGSGHVINDN